MSSSPNDKLVTPRPFPQLCAIPSVFMTHLVNNGRTISNTGVLLNKTSCTRWMVSDGILGMQTEYCHARFTKVVLTIGILQKGDNLISKMCDRHVNIT